MNSKMRSSVMGLLLGQFSSPLPEVQKEPVAYLYNGVRLPKLPEWDREKYPYAYLSVSTGFGITTVTLLCYQTLFTGSTDVWNNEGRWDWMLFADGDGFIRSTIKYKEAIGYSGEEWSDFETKNYTIDIGYVEVDGESKRYRGMLATYPSTIGFWTNFTFEAENGDEWITASEPVPVYE